MNKYLEALERLKTAPTFMGGTAEYQACTKSETLLMQDYEIVKQALSRLEAIDNANPSEALKCLESIKDALWDDDFHYQRHSKLLDTIEQVLLKAQEPKHYLKWEDLKFTYGTKTQKVRMGNTIYKIECVYYDNVKEVKLLSEDEKLLYFNFIGKYKDNVQLFNDLHLERVLE